MLPRDEPETKPSKSLSARHNHISPNPNPHVVQHHVMYRPKQAKERLARESQYGSTVPRSVNKSQISWWSHECGSNRESKCGELPSR